MNMKFRNKLIENLKYESSRKREDIRRDWGEDFYKCVKDLAEHPAVLEMKKYPHHGVTNCYQHCLHVAYYNYVLCRKLHLDARSAARGGMLHDMFLYDWHTHAALTGEHFHGFTHPAEALRQAEKVFQLNEIEKDIIYNHMWPVTIYRLPKYKETWVATLTDKYCGALESGKRPNKLKKNCLNT